MMTTEEVAENIIITLDQMARAVDSYEFGLPLYPEKVKEMRRVVSQEIVALFAAQNKSTVELIKIPAEVVAQIRQEEIVSFYTTELEKKDAEFKELADRYLRLQQENANLSASLRQLNPR